MYSVYLSLFTTWDVQEQVAVVLAVLAQTETTHAVAHLHAGTGCSSAVTQLPLSSPGLPVIATELKTMT